ncbi:hypothetical protein RI129_003739 [Pyrocoelia pectoralis]|uniref:Kinetochore protein Nuf2 n=1 Tax=Pyrocoelia pectoralis TaxID=417401 RepID=A0AAN7ZNC5_9COLE
MEMEYEESLQFINEYWPEYDKVEEQLDEPTSEFVISCYLHFREIIYTLLCQATGENVPALSLEMDLMFNLLGFVNRFLRNHCSQGIECKLTLTDLYAPTAKRTKTTFRILMNMLVVFYGNVKGVRSVIQEQKQLSDLICQTEKKREKLQTDLAQNAENLAKSQDENENLQKKYKEIDVTYKNLQDQQEDYNRHSKKLKQDLKTVVDTYQNKETLVNNLKVTVASYQEQIVNMDTLKSLQDLKENLSIKWSDLQEEVNYTAESLGFKKPDIDRLNTIQEKIESLQKIASLIHSFENDIGAVTNENKLSQSECDEDKKIIEAKKAVILKVVAIIKELNSTTQSRSEQNKINTQEICAEMDNVNLEIGQEKVLQKKLCEKKEEVEKKILECEKNRLEIRNSANSIKERSSSMYERIISAENPLITDFVQALIELKSINFGNKVEK